MNLKARLLAIQLHRKPYNTAFYDCMFLKLCLQYNQVSCRQCALAGGKHLSERLKNTILIEGAMQGSPLQYLCANRDQQSSFGRTRVMTQEGEG